MSKGSTPRPIEIPRQQFRDNWDKIFTPKPKPTPLPNPAFNPNDK